MSGERIEMYAETITRDQFAEMTHVPAASRDYTPATVGKEGKITAAKNVWYGHFRQVNYTNVEEMKAYDLTTASPRVMYITGENGNMIPLDGKKAIVDDSTGEFYSVHSDKYEVIQHDVVKEAMALACEDTGIQVFGHFDQSKGRMNGYATFTDPDCHVQLGETYSDPVMLGMRFFNSHNGDSKFGGEIFGIRKACSNYAAYGEILGRVSIMHYKSEENVAHELGKVLCGFRDKIDALADLVYMAKDDVLEPQDQYDLLLGAGIGADHTEYIMRNRNYLNPENTAADVSVYDVYNAATAFVTYRVGGSHMIKGNLSLSDKISAILSKRPDTLIAKGRKVREEIEQKLAVQGVSSPLRVRAVA